jgi:hypothetical protein
VNDGRLRRTPLPGLLRYNALSNAGGFSIGPRVDFGASPAGLLITDPVIYLAHFGANHDGTAPGENQNQAFSKRAFTWSFNYPAGAVYNTLESFNGRDFNGLGGWIGQSQLADFLGYGGTFGMGNVWEPLSFSLPDNAALVRNFVLGNLSWGEAAWSAAPGISWMQLAAGDPLARLVKKREDRDGDARMTVEDLYLWSAAPIDLNNQGGPTANEQDRTLIERAVRANRDAIDMRGQQR